MLWGRHAGPGQLPCPLLLGPLPTQLLLQGGESKLRVHGVRGLCCRGGGGFVGVSSFMMIGLFDPLPFSFVIVFITANDLSLVLILILTIPHLSSI